MVSSLLITSLALLGAAAAAPTAGKTFSVEQVPKDTNKRANGVQKTAQVYRKYGAQMPSVLEEAAAAVTGEVTATPADQYDSEYLAPVKIGSQTFNLDFDTGSADLWVFSTQLPSSESAGHSPLYKPGSTAKKLSGYSWSIQYGDGSGASGNVYRDVVTIGGVTVSSQAVEAATSVSSEFTQDTTTNGLVGLAFSSINTVSPQTQNTFFANAISELAAPVFTANLKYHAAGTYDFGYIDPAKYSGSITYVPVKTSNGFWEFTGSGYAIGSGSFKSSSIDGIADTGTTLLYLPTAAVSAYYAQVKGAQNSNTYGGYVFPCSASLPSITLGIGSYRAVVPGQYINYAPVQDGSSTCYGGIQANTGIGFSIYGDVFLKSQFVIFNGASTPQLGFAKKA